MIHPLFWLLFTLFVLAMLALDLGVARRRAEPMTFRHAIAWTAFWISLAAVFATLVYFWQGRTPALEFVTGYVVEISLSADNLFIFLVIFKYFHVPPKGQHKALFWGILGALIMRAIFILVGVGLIRRFHVIIYFFGALLIYSGIKLFFQSETEVHPEKNPVLRLFRKWMPVTKDYEGEKFFVRRTGWWATPLFVVVLLIETTDVLFAVDSIPAVLAITLNAFIVYTSNVFAILGLRSMYFALAGMMEVFHYLHYGLAVILIFVGGKMLASEYYPIPTHVALGVVAAVLAISVVASLARPKRAESTE